MHPDPVAQLLLDAPLLARCSGIAYQRRLEWANALRTLADVEGATHIYSAEHDVQGFVACRRNVNRDIVVAFRGSSSAQDWLTNLTLRKANVGRGKWVHAGFQNAHESVWRQVFDAVVARKADSRGAQILFTGHSLGGALALLAARNVVLTCPGYLNDVSVVTFGSPRVGNAAWAKDYSRLLGERTLRFVNEEDPVPRVPFWTRGFRHVGHEAFFGHPRTFVVDPPLWAKLMSDAVGLLGARRSLPLAIAADHCMDHYLRLAAIADARVREELLAPELSE